MIIRNHARVSPQPLWYRCSLSTRVNRLTRKLATELNAIPGEMALVDDEIARAELLAAERLVERLSSDMKVGLCQRTALINARLTFSVLNSLW